MDPAERARIERELKFLAAHPQFCERPASIMEFLGKGYLNIETKVRPGIKRALVEIFGEEAAGDRIAKFERAMMTGGIGIGKTTIASIIQPYFVHWTLCLEDPQDFYGLLDGSRIAFMQMSTSEKQALEVVFGDVSARVKGAQWFAENYPHDPKFTKQLRFPDKDVWILPGDSAETTFEGYNILAGILDEGDSHKVTRDKDYAEVGYQTIESRIASRYPVLDSTGAEAGHKGIIVVIGQMKKAEGFMQRMYADMMGDPKSHVTRMAIWESFGWDRYRDPQTGEKLRFFYDVKRKMIIPDGVADLLPDDENVLEVPTAYRRQFDINPVKALKDLAGIPPEVSDPFISLTDRIEAAQDRWHARLTHDYEPVDDNPSRPRLHDMVHASLTGRQDPRRRTLHIDWATSGDGDALGMAMGHIDSLIEVDGEERAYIVFDFLMRIRVQPGQEIIMSDVRKIIYELKADRRFRIDKITMDGFQSTDTIQQLRKRKFTVEQLSVDKTTWPYEDLRDAIYEHRIEFPKYMTYLRKGDDKKVNIAYRELSQLEDTGKKIDHPTKGSKDVADAMAAVVHTLMGDRVYRRGVRSAPRLQDDQSDNTPPPPPQPSSQSWNPLGLSPTQAPVVPIGLIPTTLTRRP